MKGGLTIDTNHDGQQAAIMATVEPLGDNFSITMEHSFPIERWNILQRQNPGSISPRRHWLGLQFVQRGMI
jgi:hypothetical protein